MGDLPPMWEYERTHSEHEKTSRWAHAINKKTSVERVINTVLGTFRTDAYTTMI
jgi:hypothetical protein